MELVDDLHDGCSLRMEALLRNVLFNRRSQMKLHKFATKVLVYLYLNGYDLKMNIDYFDCWHSIIIFGCKEFVMNFIRLRMTRGYSHFQK